MLRFRPSRRALQRASGARLWASDASAAAITAGGADPDLPLPLRVLARAGVIGYPAARVDHRVHDGDTVRVGPVQLVRRNLGR